MVLKAHFIITLERSVYSLIFSTEPWVYHTGNNDVLLISSSFDLLDYQGLRLVIALFTDLKTMVVLYIEIFPKTLHYNSFFIIPKTTITKWRFELPKLRHRFTVTDFSTFIISTVSILLIYYWNRILFPFKIFNLAIFYIDSVTHFLHALNMV